MNRRLRRIVASVAVALAALLEPTAFPSYAVATAAPKLSDLHRVDELKALFNQDKGKIRLVLLVSPT